MATGWIMSLFLTILPFSTAMRVWDYIFCKGPASLIIVAYCILKMYSEKLLQLQDLCVISTFIQEESKRMYNWEALVAVIESFFAPSIDKVQKLRAAAREQVEKRSKDRLLKELKSTNFTMKELETMYHDFMQKPNASINGSLSDTQFFEMIKNYSFGYMIDEKPELKSLYLEHFDTNKDGSISFKEYCIGLSILAKGLASEKIAFAFKIFDENKNGFIEKQEMVEVLSLQYKAIGFPNYYSMATYFAEVLFSKYDKDDDKRLSFEEFQSATADEPMLTRMLQHL